jgi:hypothetical protein
MLLVQPSLTPKFKPGCLILQQDAGFSAKELRTAGFSASKMMIRMAGGLGRHGLYEVRQLLDAGYTAKELCDVGFVLEGGQGARGSGKEEVLPVVVDGGGSV